MGIAGLAARCCQECVFLCSQLLHEATDVADRRKSDLMARLGRDEVDDLAKVGAWALRGLPPGAARSASFLCSEFLHEHMCKDTCEVGCDAGCDGGCEDRCATLPPDSKIRSAAAWQGCELVLTGSRLGIAMCRRATWLTPGRDGSGLH
jgi:hypothetical protein